MLKYSSLEIVVSSATASEWLKWKRQIVSSVGEKGDRTLIHFWWKFKVVQFGKQFASFFRS